MEFKGDLAQIYAGNPVKLDACNIAISQPCIKDICAVGEDDFLTGIQTFTRIEILTKPVKEGNSQLAMLDDFQVLMIILEKDVTIKVIVNKFFDLIFPDYNVKYEPGSFGFYQTIDKQEKMVGRLDPRGFEDFQKALKILFLPQGVGEEEYEYNPANEKAAEIAAKLKRGNQIRQQMKLDQEKKNNNSLFANYISCLSIGLNLSVRELLLYTPFQLYDSFNRYMKKREYDLYQKVSTTPLMDVSKIKAPDEWTGGLY